MPKLTVGGKMPDFPFETPFTKDRRMAEAAGKISGKTAVVFLRYFGCTMCQLDMRQYAAEYKTMTAGGGQMLLVLQSDPQKLAEQITPETFPYEIICDPDRELYKLLEIAPAKSMVALGGNLKTVAKMAKATAAGLKHGEYEGEELQLPAAFIVTPDLTVTYAHYGKSGGDVPGPKELAELLK